VKTLVVNADDFGLSTGVNDGVIQAHLSGIVTSASLMVRQPAAAAAVRAARAHPALSLGLHVDLAEWELSEAGWTLTYAWSDPEDTVAVRREIELQLGMFRQLVGRNPTHLDSHQHVHRQEPARTVLVELAAQLDVPLRHFSHVRYCGAFYGQGRQGAPVPDAISPAALATAIGELSAGPTELCCHPAARSEPGWAYGWQRTVELQALCSRRVLDAVGAAGARLVSFAGVEPAW
jgi:predicted glycoside hydrolase/deacetylase ChbG (UPF0249 family)